MARRSMAQGLEQMCPLCPVGALFCKWRGGLDGQMYEEGCILTLQMEMRISTHTHTHTYTCTHTHTNLIQTPPWAHVDSQILSEGIECWQRLKEDIILRETLTHTDTHTHTNIHTRNIFCFSKQAAGESALYIYIFSYSLPLLLLPIREVLLLPRWLHFSNPLTASWGMLLVKAAGSLQIHSSHSTCSNATPLLGQKKFALTCNSVFLSSAVNCMAKYTLKY